MHADEALRPESDAEDDAVAAAIVASAPAAYGSRGDNAAAFPGGCWAAATFDANCGVSTGAALANTFSRLGNHDSIDHELLGLWQPLQERAPAIIAMEAISNDFRVMRLAPKKGLDRVVRRTGHATFAFGYLTFVS